MLLAVNKLLSGGCRGADRIESAKAGAVAAVGGVAGFLPLALLSEIDAATLLLGAAPVLLSAALFGIVFRWARPACLYQVLCMLDAVAEVGLNPGPQSRLASAGTWIQQPVVRSWACGQRLMMRHAFYVACACRDYLCHHSCAGS